MTILLVEPYFTGSHKAWAEEYVKHSNHKIVILSLSGHYWKWRMHGGAITLARKFNSSALQPDLILASDMLDLNIFLSMTRKKTSNLPVAVYFHENQLTYPWSETDRDVINNRDNHYSFINYATACAASKIFFNSHYHQDSFLGELPNFLKGFPDNNELSTVEDIRQKSEVLYLGLDLKKFDDLKPAAIDKPKRAVILWNHRWEYDKNPDDFFDALFQLKDRGVDFKLLILGENFSQHPGIFEQAKEKLKDNIIHAGYVESFEEYVKWLWMADIIPVTSRQDFFGASLVQAMYCNTIPLLPKRLAYPEHIPPEFHNTFFYDNKRDFVNRLQRLIFDVRVIRKQKLAHFVAKYNWTEMATVYDEAMESVAGTP